MANSTLPVSASGPTQRGRFWLMILIAAPGVALVLYLAYVLYLRNYFATCPPNCRRADFARAELPAATGPATI